VDEGRSQDLGACTTSTRCSPRSTTAVPLIAAIRRLRPFRGGSRARGIQDQSRLCREAGRVPPVRAEHRGAECYARVEGDLDGVSAVATIGLDGSLAGDTVLVRRVAGDDPTLDIGPVDPLQRTLETARALERITRLEIVQASRRSGLGTVRAFAMAERPGRVKAEGSDTARLSIHVGEKEGVTIVALDGELDLCDAKHVRDEVSVIPTRNVVMDLAGLTFLDASGLSAIVAARRAVTARGNQFRIRGAQAMVRRVFEVTDLAHLLDD